MLWERGSAPLKAREPYLLRFRVENGPGRPARGMQLYTGMLGHAAFVRTDLTVSAHAQPHGFPEPGAYRIFVHVKRDGKIETGVFDAKVEN